MFCLCYSLNVTLKVVYFTTHKHCGENCDSLVYICTYCKNDDNVRDWFRMFLGLPFVPVAHVHQAFTVIIDRKLYDMDLKFTRKLLGNGQIKKPAQVGELSTPGVNPVT